MQGLEECEKIAEILVNHWIQSEIRVVSIEIYGIPTMCQALSNLGCCLVCKFVARGRRFFSLEIDWAEHSLPNLVIISYILTAYTKALGFALTEFLEADKTGVKSWFQLSSWASVSLSRKPKLFLEQGSANYCPAIGLFLCDPWAKSGFHICKEL